MTNNTLYYGDNLEVLRRYIQDESVDLVYLDPPFKSDQDYNVLFAEQDGSRAAAQIKAFGDMWPMGRGIGPSLSGRGGGWRAGIAGVAIVSRVSGR